MVTSIQVRIYDSAFLLLFRKFKNTTVGSAVIIRPRNDHSTIFALCGMRGTLQPPKEALLGPISTFKFLIEEDIVMTMELPGGRKLTL